VPALFLKSLDVIVEEPEHAPSPLLTWLGLRAHIDAGEFP